MEVNFGECQSSSQLVQKIINPLKKVLVFYNDLIQLAIVNIQVKTPILLLHKWDEESHREAPGLMKFFARRSFNYSFNSLNSSGDIRYGPMEIGLVLGN